MKPLMIEELKALPVGEWVWIENIGTDWKAYYRVVYCPEKEVAFWGAIRQAERFLYSNYGIKWLAYKNKEQAEECKNTCVLDNEQELERLEKAEEMAEKSLCEVKCLCPSIKEAGTCCQCEVFTSLRDYYFEELESVK